MPVSSLIVLGIQFLLGAGSTQAPVRTPPLPQPYEHYGTPTPSPLSEVAGGMFAGTAVQTKGVVSLLDSRNAYFKLSEGDDRVVLIPVPEMPSEMRSLLGRRVEVIGLVRELPERQGTCLSRRQVVPQSLCDHPDLPVLPDRGPGRVGWPRVSITVWSIGDITALERGRGPGGPSPLARLLAATAPSREPVHILGRFCGANLCGGLGASPAVGAWVLQDGSAAVWVVGREPKGNGWRLDPGDPGDTSRWLEVVGRLQACGKTVCVRAQSVALAATPATSPSP